MAIGLAGKPLSSTYHLLEVGVLGQKQKQCIMLVGGHRRGERDSKVNGTTQ